MITTREQLFQSHKDTCEKAFAIMQVKNKDYGATNDALSNFRLCALLGVPMTDGIVTRLGDKLARVGHIVTSGETAVKTETVQDTILDAINYLVILKAALDEKETPLGHHDSLNSYERSKSEEKQ